MGHRRQPGDYARPNDLNSNRIHRTGANVGTKESERKRPKSQRESTHNPTWRAVQIERSRSKCSNVIRHPSWLLVRCCVANKCDGRYNGRSTFLLQVRYNMSTLASDCSFGAICARWRGLGILSLARLAQIAQRA
jgi:hypothetical protein